ncbi:hypothetical protein T484DRAFT_1839031 [Baffinella frigidus]|nr:hypothetical protein T484DRAFT_1839031 [Cryptophyta sp. CCMP2293]
MGIGALAMWNTVVVCGLVKNNAEFLQDSLDRLLGLRRVFGGVKVVLFENDSTDGTVAIIKETQRQVVLLENDSTDGTVAIIIKETQRQHPGVITLLQETNLPANRTNSETIRVLAYGRNRVMRHALQNHPD